MNPFPWHSVDLGLKLALAPHAWFDPVLEWYTPPSDFSHGTYFGLARCGDAGDRRGYLATQDFHGKFRECEFPLEELEALEKTLNAISIPLGSSVGAFDGAEGLIRVYHGGQGWIDFFFRDTEQPQWESLLEFIRQTAERYLPSPPATAWPDLFGDAEPQEPACRDTPGSPFAQSGAENRHPRP